MFKKITIAVLGLAASGLATAGSMGPACVPGNVTVPCEARGWELGAEALYLRSIYGAEKGYQVLVSTVSPTGLNPELRDARNDWNWGYRLKGGYYFNTGNDVNVNWMHFSSTADQANVATPALVGGFLIYFPSAYSNSNRLDQVNIVMGQHVDFSANKKMRFYGGMQYANIQSNGQTALQSPLIALLTGSSFSLFSNSDFKGFGPTTGIDYSYQLTDGLSVTANGAASLLYGTTRYHAGLVLNAFNLIGAQLYASKKAIVPSLEAKLGLNYAYPMAQGIVNINAGYQVVNYFNPLSAQRFQTLTEPVISSINYGAFGPYFGLKYVGNA